MIEALYGPGAVRQSGRAVGLVARQPGLRPTGGLQLAGPRDQDLPPEPRRNFRSHVRALISSQFLMVSSSMEQSAICNII